MDREVLKGFARIGFFVGGGGLILLFFEPRNSPEWVISLCSSIIGVLLVVGVMILSRWRR
ncbi:MAG: hypothetical protein KF716_32890 [Anaerolineae bacterium]|nr:hypothetical protein [Anaerolineae bacterium]